MSNCNLGRWVLKSETSCTALVKEFTAVSEMGEYELNSSWAC